MTEHATGFVAFDLDGTLIDSVYGLYLACLRMTEDLDLQPVNEQGVRNWVGNGMPALIKRAMTLNDQGEQQVADDDPQYLKASDSFYRHYAETMNQGLVVYDGVRECLQQLEKAKLPMALITNKREVFTRQILKDLELDSFFQVIVGGDTLATTKPDPAGLHFVADKLGLPVDSGTMVGDSKTDIETGRNAGCFVIAVTYGYNHGVPVESYQPDVVTDSLADLMITKFAK